MATVNEKMTAIADKIRSYVPWFTGTNNNRKFTLDDMAHGVDLVHQEQQSEINGLNVRVSDMELELAETESELDNIITIQNEFIGEEDLTLTPVPDKDIAIDDIAPDDGDFSW